MLSQNEIRELIEKTLADRLGANSFFWIVDVYPDHLIYEQKERYYRCDYAIVDGAATLGANTEVTKQVSYVPLQAAGQFLAAVGDPAGEDYGYTWRIQICKYGPAKGRAINWPREPLVAAIPVYEGARVFCLMDTQHVQAADRPCGKSVREIVGWVENVAESAAGDALEGDFQILKSAKWLRDSMVDAFARGKKDLIGFSHDVSASTTTRLVAGRRLKEPVTIRAVEIDVVYDPTNEGKFLRMVAAGSREGENDVNREQLVAALKKARPNFATDNMSDEQLLEALTAAAIEGAGGDQNNAQLVAAVVAGFKEALGPGTTGADALREVRLMAAGATLDRELGNSKLPEKFQASLRKRFEGQEFKVEELQAAIKEQKELIDDLTGSGGVSGAGGLRATVGRESVEKLQAAFDGMLGVQVADDLRGVPVFRSLRAAYVEMTGDTDITGVLDPQQQRRLQAAYGDTTFAYVLGNTLYRRLVQDYHEVPDYGVSRLVGGNIRNARDFRTLESIRIGYYGDLPTVDTDIQDYPDLGEVSDEKVEFALKERGGIITINRRTIINDDLRVVQKIINRLPRAARRTVARTVWTPFISNSNYKGDNKAIFHADHGNLGSTAYGIASALAARNAMSVQTEPGSGERISCCRPATVAFPVELYGIVKNVNDFNPQAVEIANGNSMYGYFKPEGLLECPLLTDATDWYMFADPNECEIVELAYLNGQQEPVMVVADNPSVGQMFVGGRIQYRITHDHNAEVVDFRGAYKASVA